MSTYSIETFITVDRAGLPQGYMATFLNGRMDSCREYAGWTNWTRAEGIKAKLTLDNVYL